MQTEIEWKLKMAEVSIKSVQKSVSKEDAHELQAAIEIIKGVAQRQGGKK